LKRAHEIINVWNSSNLENVTSIDLSNKSYTLEAAQVLMGYLTNNNLLANVVVANLSDMIASRMEEEGLAVLKHVCDTVALQCPLLESVDLSDNAMGSKGISACEAVFTQCTKLHSVQLCNNGLAEHTMDQVVELLTAESMAARLQRVHFYNNMSGHGGCVAFCKLLRHCNGYSLTNVRFSGTRADRPGSLLVVEAMHAFSQWNVSWLDLADNTFGKEGGAVLAQVLSKCTNLTYLNIRDCCLDDMSIFVSICKALIYSKCPLEYLNVSGNDLTLKGAQLGLVPLMQAKKCTLKSIHVEENDLTSRGVECLAATVSPLLQDINLATNQCGSSGARAWIAARDKMPNLQLLNLDGNAIPDHVVREMEAVFGEVLVDMVDNEGDNDADDDLTEAEEDDDNDELVESDTEADKVEMGNLAAEFEHANI